MHLTIQKQITQNETVEVGGVDPKNETHVALAFKTIDQRQFEQSVRTLKTAEALRLLAPDELEKFSNIFAGITGQPLTFKPPAEPKPTVMVG